MIYKTIYDKLKASATITNNIATYNGAAAIFTSPVPPADITCPYILITNNSGGLNNLADPRCLSSWSEDIYVRVYDNKVQSANTINTITKAIFTALNRADVNETDAKGFLICRGSSIFVDADGFPGSLTIVTANLWE